MQENPFQEERQGRNVDNLMKVGMGYDVHLSLIHILKKSEILSEVKRADVLLFLLHQVRDLTGTRR